MARGREGAPTSSRRSTSAARSLTPRGRSSAAGASASRCATRLVALPRDRHPGRAARHRARLPDGARRRRARGAAAGRRLVRGGQVAGAGRAAGRRRVPDRLGLVVGLGVLQPQRRRRGQGARACVYLWTRAPALCDGPRPRGAELRRRRGRTARSGCRRRASAGSSAAAGSTPARSRSAAGDGRPRAWPSPSSSPGTAEAREASVTVRARARGRAGGDRVALRRQRGRVSVGAAAREGERRGRAGGDRRRAAPARARAPDARARAAGREGGLDLLPLATRTCSRASSRRSPRRGGSATRPRASRISSVAPDAGLHARAGRPDERPRARRDVRGRRRSARRSRSARSVRGRRGRAIAAALRAFARRAAFEALDDDAQESLMKTIVCTRDELPSPGTVRLTGFLPFLR